MRVFIGLDVSLAKTAVCVVDRDGAVQWQGGSKRAGPLIKRLAEWSGIIELVGIEACPLSEWLHRGLREAGYRSRVSRRGTRSAFCLHVPSKLTRTTPAASPR
jgi:transposase